MLEIRCQACNQYFPPRENQDECLDFQGGGIEGTIIEKLIFKCPHCKNYTYAKIKFAAIAQEIEYF